jgi:1-deoxy-D-xylulose-5-phosphate reductoisomerase
MKKIAILGSTGSIGTQTLDIIDNSNDYQVTALAAHSNFKLLEEQIRKFKPGMAALFNEEAAKELRIRTRDTNVKILGGEEGVNRLASECGADTVLTAMVGSAGIMPTLNAISAGCNIALANKETMVCAGEIVSDLAERKNVKIIPVDSEHSAIFQCIGNHKSYLKNIILTASGGPFFGRCAQELKSVTLQDALKHPNWSMGSKITIDSATLMNKGLEVIEAVKLFDISPDSIKVLVHRQSIIHSMVEFCDNSVLAQLGNPDMRVPISYALSYPERKENPSAPLKYESLKSLSFEEPDLDTFKGLALGFYAAREGGTMPTVYSSANEAAVELFISGKCTFLEISSLVEFAMKNHKKVIKPTLKCIIDTDNKIRQFVKSLV